MINRFFAGMLAGSCFLLASLASAATVEFNVAGFQIRGDNPISESRTRQILAPYTGQHEGIQRLREAASQLETDLNSRGYDFHRVTLPPQVLKDGTVILEIRKLVIGEIYTSGNKYFSDTNLILSIPQLRSGETPNTRSLSRTLATANFNTAKITRLTFGRGQAPDTVDARIEVNDQPPVQVYTWANNTGTEESTRSRLGLGVQHRNLFGRDHDATATYTTSPEEPSDLKQYGINYRIPVYRTAGMLGLLYVKSDIDSGRVANVFNVSGGGTTGGLSYTQVLNKYGDYKQRLSLNLLDKLFDNDVDFEGEEIGVDVRSRPLSLMYQLEWRKKPVDGRINVGYAVNLDGGSFNTQADYSASRIGAMQDWSAFRLNANFFFPLPRTWSFEWAINAQYADEPLISGERLGLGGVNGPRGFAERETSVDRGANNKLQLWVPPLASNLQFGAFVDYGYGRFINPQAGEIGSLDLSSLGVSGKWQWRNRLVARLDVGHVISGFGEINPDLTQDGDNKAHISLVYRFKNGTDADNE